MNKCADCELRKGTIESSHTIEPSEFSMTYNRGAWYLVVKVPSKEMLQNGVHVRVDKSEYTLQIFNCPFCGRNLNPATRIISGK